MLDVGPHRERGGRLAAVEEDGGAGHPVQRRAPWRAARRRTPRSGPSSCSRRRVTSSRPRCQVVRTVNVAMPISSGSHAPCTSLVRFAAKNSRSTVSRNAGAGRDEPQRLAPLVTDDVEEQQGRDRDRAGHRHAEREGQRGRALEREHEREHGDQQQPVDPRDVDLARSFLRGVSDPQPRQVAELDGLMRDRERAGDDRLRGDDRRGGGEEDQRQLPPGRDEQEERAADAGRVAQDQGALSQVAQDAGGEDEDQPGARDRRAAEVPHVRVQRLGAGDREHDRGQREERDPEMAEEEAQRVAGRQRLQDLRVAGDAAHADTRRSRGTRRPSPARTGGRRRPCPAAGRETGRR